MNTIILVTTIVYLYIEPYRPVCFEILAFISCMEMSYKSVSHSNSLDKTDNCHVRLIVLI